MGEANDVPRKINKVEGAAGQVITSGGPDVLETWETIAAGATVVTGSYTGDGGATARQITTGFRVSFGFGARSDVSRSFIVMKGISSAVYLENAQPIGLASQIYTHATDGFVVADGSTSGNVDLQVYDYWMISE